jgi:hypothetical protein
MSNPERRRRFFAGNGAVNLTIRRFEAAGLSWPLSDDITDTELEARLFTSAGAGTGYPAGSSLDGGAPRTPAQAGDAVDPSGGVRRGRARRLFSHVAVLVTAFDLGADPAADFLRMRMEPSFG